MLLALSAALAGQLALSLGPSLGVGGNEQGSWTSWSPMTAVSYKANLLFVEAWGGTSASILLARPDGEVNVAVAPLNLDLGLGFGGKAFGAGLLWTGGFTGNGVGLYSHLSFPSNGWIRRMGAEVRLVRYEAQDTTAAAVLWRIVPGIPERTRKRDKEQAPEEAPPPVHHDDPYGDSWDT